MNRALLDVNVLLALCWDSHPHFAATRQWFTDQHPRWASCPLTELGFIRLSSNNKVIANAGTPQQALQGLTRLRQHPRHEFWADDFSPADESLFGKLQGHNQTTDAYLLCLAVKNRGVLVSFDAGTKNLAGTALGDERRVVLLAA